MPKKKEETIIVEKVQRQVQIVKTNIQVLLSSELQTEDMNYLVDKAVGIVKEFSNEKSNI